jgi:hypothetical protein
VHEQLGTVFEGIFPCASVWSGTLRPPVRVHDVKKDISMLMGITNDTSVALSKSQRQFSKS